MYLTATFKVRANRHDAARLRVSLRRWHAAFAESMELLCKRRGPLRRACLKQWTSKDGKRTRLVIDGKQAHAFVLAAVPALPHLHSSARMSMIVTVEEQAKSWLGLLADWENGGRKLPEPAFPSVKPGSAKEATLRWEAVLKSSDGVGTLEEENAWRAEVTRAAKGSLLPQYFGSCMSGAASQAHCGILKRDDGRYFALLTLFPQGDPLGEPVARARNRTERGDIRNVRVQREHVEKERDYALTRQLLESVADLNGADLFDCAVIATDVLRQIPPQLPLPQPFAPTDRARASILCPLELEHGHEHLFFGRGVPKSAELIERDGAFFLHVAFDQGEPEKRATPNLLTLKRGIRTLAAAVVTDPDGRELQRQAFCGRDLARLVTEMDRVRALRQAQGTPTAGDRRVSRVAEHHLYSVGHQIIDMACRYQAAIVILEDTGARLPNPYLRFKHWHRLAEILGQLAAEAGLPEPKERRIYGSFRTCLRCGWKPGDTVRGEAPELEQCGRCGTRRDPEYHLARLLAHSERRLAVPEADRLPLGEFIRRAQTLKT